MKWLNRDQPQTLFSAVLLCYFSAAFLAFGSRVDWQFAADMASGVASLFSAGSDAAAGSPGGLVPLAVTLLLGGSFVAGGLGTANERRWGHWLCSVAVVYSTLATLWWGARTGFQLGIGMRLMFDVLLVALLFHPLSRNHRRVWFR